MIRLLSILTMIFCSLSTVMKAEEVSVRAGEHSDFTRFVLSVPKDTKWQVGTIADLVTITLTGDRSFDFNTRNTFDRISRKRILETLSTKPGELRVKLNCDCDVRSFFQEPNLIVIDVSDGKSASESAIRNSSFNSVDDASKQISSLLKATKPYAPAASRKVAEQVAEAATRQTLLRTTESEAGRNTRKIEVSNVFEIKDAVRNIALSNTSDDVSHTGSLSKGTCTLLAKAPLGSSDNNQPFYAPLGHLQAATYDAHGDVDHPAIVSLVQWYLAHGLATEAILHLQLLPQHDPDTHLLHSIAQTIEGVRPVGLNIFRKQAHCSAFLSLMAFLSGSIESDQLNAGHSLEHAVAKLPTELLKDLTPRLIQKFENAGMSSAAVNTSKRVKRARMANANNEDFEKNLLSGNEIQHQNDVVKFATEKILTKFEENSPISKSELDLISSVAFETRTSDASETSIKAEIYALISHKLYLEANEKLKSVHMSQDTTAKLYNRLYTSLVENSDDFQFLKFVTNFLDDLAQRADRKIRIAVIGRLKALKFHDLATEFDQEAKRYLSRVERVHEKAPEADILNGAERFEIKNQDALSKPSSAKNLEKAQPDIYLEDITIESLKLLADTSSDLMVSVQKLIREDLEL